MSPYNKLIVSTALFLGCVHSLTSAPINNNTALTPAEGEWILREQVRYTKKRVNDSLAPKQSVSIVTLPNIVLYGITAKFNILLSWPLLRKELHIGQQSDRKVRDDFGFGDLLLLGKYRILSQDKIGETLRAGLFAGLEFPTGDSSASDKFGELPRPIQLGSGSWDPFIGAVFTWATLQQQVDIVGEYKWNTKGRGFEFGDTFRHDFSFQYRILPWKMNEKRTTIPSFIYFVLEANGVFSKKNKSGAITDENSGGYTLLVSPGIQYVKERFIAEASIQFPAVRAVYGIQPRDKYTIVFGVRAQF